MAGRNQTKQKGRLIAGPDAGEVEALAFAVEVAKSYGLRVNAETATAAIISAWITTRSRLHTSHRLTETVVFDLKDAKLEGMIEASLPKIGDALAAAYFPFDKSFSDLTKMQAVTLFLAGCVAYREAAVAAGEDPEFPFEEAFNDAVPFGQDEETPPWE